MATSSTSPAPRPAACWRSETLADAIDGLAKRAAVGRRLRVLREKRAGGPADWLAAAKDWGSRTGQQIQDAGARAVAKAQLDVLGERISKWIEEHPDVIDTLKWGAGGAGVGALAGALSERARDEEDRSYLRGLLGGGLAGGLLGAGGRLAFREAPKARSDEEIPLPPEVSNRKQVGDAAKRNAATAAAEAGSPPDWDPRGLTSPSRAVATTKQLLQTPVETSAEWPTTGRPILPGAVLNLPGNSTAGRYARTFGPSIAAWSLSNRLPRLFGQRPNWRDIQAGISKNLEKQPWKGLAKTEQQRLAAIAASEPRARVLASRAARAGYRSPTAVGPGGLTARRVFELQREARGPFGMGGWSRGRWGGKAGRTVGKGLITAAPYLLQLYLGSRPRAESLKLQKQFEELHQQMADEIANTPATP